MSGADPRRARAVGVRAAAVAGAVLLLAACAGGTPDPGATGSGSTPSVAPVEPIDVARFGGPEPYAQLLFDATNAARTAEGLDTLTPSACAAEQGAGRADELVGEGGELVHAPMAPVTAACKPATMSGENLSRAAAAPEDVVDAWMASPGHRSNILTPEFTDMGISCVAMPAEPFDEMLCSQIFLGR